MQNWCASGTSALPLKPQFPYTDLLGAMPVAAHYLGESPEKDRKLLVIFSNMRQSTRVLDLEHKVPQAQNALRQAAKQELMADLRGVEVHALGVDVSGGQSSPGKIYGFSGQRISKTREVDWKAIRFFATSQDKLRKHACADCVGEVNH